MKGFWFKKDAPGSVDSPAPRSLIGRAGRFPAVPCAAEHLEPRLLLAAVSWDGGGDGSSWSDPANWSEDRLPRPRDVVVIGAEAAVEVGARGERITIRRLQSDGALTLNGGTLRTRGGMRIDGEINVLANTTLRAGKRFHLGAITESNGARLVLRGSSIFVTEAASISGLSRFTASAPIELWFAGAATAPMITLNGGDTARTIITGVLDASSQRPRGDAGTVHVLGREVYLHGASIDARGRFGGGQVRIGGDYTGQGELPRAQHVYIDPHTIVRADSRRQGDGGTVVVWSDSRTIFDGQITATAGRLGGDGGLIETSSKGLLSIGRGQANAAAARGKGGLWLLDPYNIVIDSVPDANITITPGDPIVFTGTLTGATVSTASITAALNVGTSVTIATAGAGAEEGTIDVFADIVKTAGADATLTFQADSGFTLLADIRSTAGALEVVINAGGLFSSPFGSIQTNGGRMEISAVGFSLGVTAFLNSDNGDFLLQSFGPMVLDGAIAMGAGAGVIQTSSGDIIADTSIIAASVQVRADNGSVTVGVIEAATIELEASDNVTLGGGSGGLFTAFSFIDVHAGTDGTGAVTFGSLVQVQSGDVRLRAGDGEGGAAASATVNAVTNSPVFQSVDGGGTTPDFFTIRQDADLSDAQIPGPSAFGSGSMPGNLSLQSDDGSLTIISPSKVQNVNLSVAALGSFSIGALGQTMMPASLVFDNTPPTTIVSGTLENTTGGISFPSNVVLATPSVSIVSPGMIEFVGTVNGGSNLVVSSPQIKDFVGEVGTSVPLLSLTVNGGTTRFYKDVTAATITINTPTIIFYTVVMTASAVGPIFQSSVTVNHMLDELHIRGASPQFNGGDDSVSGPGLLSIAPADPAAAMVIGGAFLSAASFAAIAPGFARTDFGTASQTGAIDVVIDTLVNDTRFITGDGHLTHSALSVLGGRSVSFEVNGIAVIIYQGEVLTSGGSITYDGPLIINDNLGLFGTTQSGAAAGADITFNSTVYPGDGQFPNLEFRAGETGIVTLAEGLSEQSFAFQSLSVFGGPGGAIRTFGDIWLGDSGTEFFDTESPLELGSDVTINVSNARFLNGLRSFGSPHSLIIFGSGVLELHGVSLANLESTFLGGETSLHGAIAIDNFAEFNGLVRVMGIGSISANTLALNGEVDLNELDLSLAVDYLDIGDDISGGGGVSTLTIAPRSVNQGVSVNESDSGLWLSAVELARIQDGLARLIFGRLDGTAQLTIGTTSFSDPVEFRMAGPGASIGLIGSLTGTGDASITFFGSGGTTTLLGNITTQSEPIVFNDAILIAVPLVTLSTIGNESSGADIIFNGLVGSTGGEANSLSLQAGIGNIEFNGGVGIVPGDELGTLTTDAGGLVLISGGFVATTLNQNWNRSITLLADTVLCGQTGFITINQPINAGAFNLTLKADDVNINAAISGTGNLKIAPFTLTRDVYINLNPLGGGALIVDSFEKSQIQDGWNSVTFGEEGGDAQMVVGGGDYSDPTEFVMSGMGGNSTVEVVQEISGSGNGTIIIRGGGSTTHLFASIITQGNAITIFDRVILRTPLVTLDSTDGGAFPTGGKIEIHGDVDSQNAMGHSLLIDPGLDELELFGELGNGDGGLLGMFTTGLFGTAILRGGIIKTIGQQLYQGPVLIPTDLFLSTLGAPIVFEEEVTGDENLTIGEGSGETSFEDETSFESLTIEFGDTRTFNGPTTIGTLTVLGGIVNFNAAGKIGGGALVSGTLSGTDIAYIDGEFEWQGGLVEGDGLLVIRPSGVFSFGGASERTLARDVQVEGVLLWTSGHLYLRDSVITVLSNGTFDVRSSGTMLPENGSQGQIVNQGLIERTFPGAAAMVDLTVSNTGEIRITSGSLKITPLSGTFTNDGVITLGPVGSLIIRGDYIHAATATLNIIIAGTGVGHFGRLIVLGEAILDGHVATTFHDEYVPSAGDEYKFLQADSRTGAFATQSIDPPPAGLLASIVYDADGARLVISAALFGDTDGDGSLTVHDIFMFLENWFNGDGDFDGDGETTVNDIFAFLTAWFAQ